MPVTHALVLIALAASAGAPEEKALASPARTLLDVSGTGPNFGWEIDVIGDVDGDGIDELIVPAPFRDANNGRVEVFSGRTGTRLHDLPGSTGSRFGISVDTAGDVDRDGYDDIAVGAPTEAPNGAIYVYSGKDGRQLLRIAGPTPGLGVRVVGAGDIDRDDHGDLLAAASAQGAARSQVYLFSGRTGATLLTIESPGDNQRFGGGLALGADYDGDRLRDILVGAPGASRAYVYTSAGGNLLRTIAGPAGSVAFGQFFISDAGDFDRDGTADIHVSDTAFAGGPGAAYVYSGASGNLVSQIRGAGLEGLGCGRGAGDLDGDGFADLVIGSYLSGGQAGEVKVFGGPSFRLLQTVSNGDGGEQFGFDAGTIGDVDGDGRIDLVGAAAGGNRVYAAAGTAGAARPLQAIARRFSGIWMDPSHNGEGFAVEMFDATTAGVYWFTYNRDGTQRYFVGVGRVVGPRIVFQGLVTSRGGRLGGGFDGANVERRPEARLVLSFDECNRGHADYTASGERRQQRIERLSGIAGLDCAGGAGAATARYSGSWYDPAAAGEGWFLHGIGNDAYVLGWFTYDASGAQQWFSSVGQLAGDTLSFPELTRSTGGRFGEFFRPSEVQRAPFGRLTMRFTSCTRAAITFETPAGSGSVDVQRLTSFDGVPCG